MKNCEIITISNQKGGTGKTTTTCNLGNALAKKGNRVLLVDIGPQSNLSLSFGIELPDEIPISMHNVLTMIMDGETLPEKSKYIIKGDVLDIIPCNVNLSFVEINLRGEVGGEHTLSELLEPLRPEYEYIIIDSNPYLGLLTINALATCDEVIIPASPQLWLATELTDLLKTIFKMKKKINPWIEIAWILLTVCDERTKLFREIQGLLDDHYSDRIKIFNTYQTLEANYFSKRILDYDANCKASIAYKKFATEVAGNGGTN